MIVLSIALPWLLVAVLGWFGYLYLRHLGKVLLRLDAIEAELAAQRIVASGPTLATPGNAGGTESPSLAKSRINRSGLAPGENAPTFRLPLLSGFGEIALEDFRGRSVLLLLVSTDCQPCSRLLEELGRVDALASHHMIIVARGTREEVAVKFAAFDLSVPVAIEESWHTSRAYGTFKFPSAYVVTPEGRIGSRVISGADAIHGVVVAFVEGKASLTKGANHENRQSA